jgi:hypothetical protein
MTRRPWEDTSTTGDKEVDAIFAEIDKIDRRADKELARRGDDPVVVALRASGLPAACVEKLTHDYALAIMGDLYAPPVS